MTTTSHRAAAERWLGYAENHWSHRRNAAALAAAQIAQAHAVLAGPTNRCESCGIERQVQHEDWCDLGKPAERQPGFKIACIGCGHTDHPAGLCLSDDDCECVIDTRRYPSETGRMV